MSEFTLVRQFINGDVTALEALMKAENGRVMSYIRRYVRDQESIDDIYQNAWMQIWINREQLRLESKFRSWAYQILRNCIFEFTRKKNWGIEMFFFDPDSLPVAIAAGPDPCQQSAKHEWRLILNQEIERLDKCAQEIFSLRLENELNLREISEVLNLPLNTVKSKFRRSVRKLRERLEAHNISVKELNIL